MTLRKFSDVAQLLEDMRSYAVKARQFAMGRSHTGLVEDEQYRFSILYALQVVGEAASKVPGEVRQLEQSIPWPLVVGFRHVAVHGYGKVRLEVVQSILDGELESLITALESLLNRVRALGDGSLKAPDA